MIDDSGPIFLQIAALIENDIVSGALPEEGQVPSTNEFAQFYRINPATAAKGVNTLVDEGILYKRRGIGMFVAAGARDRLLGRRRDDFRAQFVQPLCMEADKLGISRGELLAMLTAALDGAGPEDALNTDVVSTRGRQHHE
ncbi:MULTISPECIES: GntR family transcriptional regulator [Arthrobacter]|uniref:GntR family transcriptional regulator n=2 Tax=Arthrobacter TaxID=1663 RepID=A0ABU9KNK4_9MICC|nr:GntR family transcriptional regulator [Arthrobacter sp. YJM1]MDP5228360.1 GntR family transcriptional regulator [Arthrobacter sp. YJM1]